MNPSDRIADMFGLWLVRLSLGSLLVCGWMLTAGFVPGLTIWHRTLEATAGMLMIIVGLVTWIMLDVEMEDQ